MSAGCSIACARTTPAEVGEGLGAAGRCDAGSGSTGAALLEAHDAASSAAQHAAARDNQPLLRLRTAGMVEGPASGVGVRGATG